jgi:hypothetical protein
MSVWSWEFDTKQHNTRPRFAMIRKFSPNIAVRRTQHGYSGQAVTRVRVRYSPEARTNENIECVLLLSNACCPGILLVAVKRALAAQQMPVAMCA